MTTVFAPGIARRVRREVVLAAVVVPAPMASAELREVERRLPRAHGAAGRPPCPWERAATRRQPRSPSSSTQRLQHRGLAGSCRADQRRDAAADDDFERRGLFVPRPLFSDVLASGDRRQHVVDPLAPVPCRRRAAALRCAGWTSARMKSVTSARQSSCQPRPIPSASGRSTSSGENSSAAMLERGVWRVAARRQARGRASRRRRPARRAACGLARLRSLEHFDARGAHAPVVAGLSRPARRSGRRRARQVRRRPAGTSRGRSS